MLRLFARLAVAGLVASALAAGPAAQPAGAAAAPAVSSADVVTCDQAKAAYAEARTKHRLWLHKLARAKKALHQAHAHGTAAELQRAKNRVRRAKGKVFEYGVAMDQAAAQVAALC
jgi:hypothetical protein